MSVPVSDPDSCQTIVAPIHTAIDHFALQGLLAESCDLQHCRNSAVCDPQIRESLSPQSPNLLCRRSLASLPSIRQSATAICDALGNNAKNLNFPPAASLATPRGNSFPAARQACRSERLFNRVPRPPGGLRPRRQPERHRRSLQWIPPFAPALANHLGGRSTRLFRSKWFRASDLEEREAMLG